MEEAMNPPDPMWEDVYASVRPHEVCKDRICFRVELREPIHQGLVTSNYLVDENEFRDMKFDAHKAIFERLIEEVDKTLTRIEMDL